MITVFTVAALVGLIILAVGAVLYLIIRPTLAIHLFLMVLGGLIYAVAQIVLILDALI